MEEGSSRFGSSETPTETVWEGLSQRALVAGPYLRIDEFFFDMGITADAHTHAVEEAGYVVTGEFAVQLGDELRHLGPGDAWSVPAGLEHGVKCLEAGSYVMARLGATDH